MNEGWVGDKKRKTSDKRLGIGMGNARKRRNGILEKARKSHVAGEL